MAHRLLLLVAVEIILNCGNPIKGDVFSSSAQLQMLAEGEIELIDALKSYITSERRKLDELDRLVGEVEEFRTPLQYSSNVDHPVDAFRLLQRFTTTWKEDILSLIYDSTAIEGLKAVVDSLRDLLPSDDDYNGAKSALIRLQNVYELNVADVINGKILDQTTRPMTQQMAVDVGVLALDRNMSDDALLWLTHAQKHSVPPLIPLQDIYRAISRAHAQKDQFVEAEYFAKKANEMDPSKVVEKVLANESGQTTESYRRIDSKGYYHLCRQYRVQDTIRMDGTLSCYYERSRINPIFRTKVEMLFRSPDIIMIHDFVTVNEAAELRHVALPKMKRGVIVDNNLTSSVSELRVGKVAWLNDEMGRSLVDRISKRIFEITGLETKSPSAEPLQLANYGMGGHYHRHVDNFQEHTNYQHVELSERTKKNGDRIATLMIYLNHVRAGGATVFPLLDLAIRPVENAAVLWYNYKRSGFSEPLTQHAGCPVLIGEKWVANKWIREFGQVFRRPCDLSIDI